MEQRIKEVMGSVFHLKPSEIPDDASTDTIQQWDSIRHMHLIVGLEEEFNTTIKESEMLEMFDYQGILKILQKRV